MAPREIVAAPGVTWQVQGKPPEDIWQGYHVRRTENGGIEFIVRTAGFNWSLLLVGLTIVFVEVLITFAAVPGPAPGDRNACWGCAVFAILFGLMLVNMLVAVGVFALLPDELRYAFKLEALEIRPDGVTVNRDHFFYTYEVFSLGVSKLYDNLGEFGYGVGGIIGTRSMKLLGGIDEPTSKVLAAGIEEAKRSRWAAPEFDD